MIIYSLLLDFLIVFFFFFFFFFNDTATTEIYTLSLHDALPISVLPVLRYTDIDDVIARANDTDFGLGGSVWSSDLERAFGVAARINSGTVWVNKHLDVRAD